MKTTAILFAAFFSCLASAQPPNILFIVADDQNTALGCYGNGVIKTPNLDRLASMGVRFDRAYCNYPICNASRTSFLSGRRPETTKVYGNANPPRTALGADFQFLPEYMKAQGYYTASIGKIAHEEFQDTVKWDLTVSMKELSKLATEAASVGKPPKPAPKTKKQKRQEKEARAAAGHVEEDRVRVPLKWRATDNKDEHEPDGMLARRVAKLMEERRDGPFFIAAGFKKPHLSHTAPKKYFDMYPVEKIPSVVEPTGHAKDIPKAAYPPQYVGDLTDLQTRTMIAHYYAASTFMDAQVGVLLEAMDRLELWENTIVVFIGDHGWHLGEHGGFWQKMSIMEESARSPLIVVAPGRKANQPSARLVEFVDLFPTLCELAGAPLQPGLEGTSFVPLLDNPQRPWKSAAFCVVSRGGSRDLSKLGRSVRTERFTYLEWFDGTAQLYDHAADPKEYVNLANDAGQAQTVADMKRRLQDGWQAARPH